jgi:hypothetical protein
MHYAPTEHIEQISTQLRQGLKTSKSLAQSLAVSQPTISRAIMAMGDAVVRIGAARSIQYAIKDPSRAALQAPLYRVTPDGQLETLGTLIPVAQQGFVMLEATGKALHSDGLPWWLYDMRPQGYLGRAYNQRHGAALGLPERLNDWSDSDVLRALLLEGADLPGNLLIGTAARDQFINSPPPQPIAAAQVPQAYVDYAAAAARGELQGSSAAGEQPKFTAYVQHQGAMPAHVMVKFSSATAGPVSARWRDILLAEHLALQVLNAANIPAARSKIIDHGGQRFLEVQRFDRLGALGRRALHSLAALDAEFVGRGGRWTDICPTLRRAQAIEPEAEQGAALLWAFGTLIGNTDMHTGNLSFISDQGRPYQLAPAYDMTPMAFAPTPSGDLPTRTLPLHIGDQVAPQVWRRAQPLAQAYIRQLQLTRGWSESFAGCISQLEQHVNEAARRIARLGD